jgi:hypothetical protein
MVGPAWTQVLLIALVAVPAVVVAGITLMLAIGGVIGCVECACCRFGLSRFAPGVIVPSERRVAAT